MTHVHGNYNILCGGELMLCLCMGDLIFASILQIICLDYLQMWWKDMPLWFCVLCILHLQLDISDGIRIVYIYNNSIIIVINKIIWIFIWLFLKTLVIITKYVTIIANIQSLWLNNRFWKFIAPEPPKKIIAQTIQSCWSFKQGCIKWSWFIFSWCGVTYYT